MPLTSKEDQRHLTVAEGYAELGLFLDANAENEEIAPELRHVPEVLVVRARIHRALKSWELMRTVASRLAAHDPGNTEWAVMLADATRRAQSIEAARRILLEAVERQPEAAILHYTLACYECRLGELEVAKSRLQHAIKLDAKFRLIALDDDDLKPIWNTLVG